MLEMSERSRAKKIKQLAAIECFTDNGVEFKYLGANFFLIETGGDYGIMYNSTGGRWQNQDPDSAGKWYHSKSPQSFLDNYIIRKGD